MPPASRRYGPAAQPVTVRATAAASSPDDATASITSSAVHRPLRRGDVMTRPGRSRPVERTLQVPAAGAPSDGHRPPGCSLARGAPGLAGRRLAREGSGDLDDHELLQPAEAQRHLHEPELSRLDPVRPDLRLEKAGPAMLLPGEYVEETA